MQPPFVVVHVPHSSPEIPRDLLGRFSISGEKLQAELRRMTDWYTDELFALPPELATTLRYPVSRLVVDPERFEDDEREPMAKIGMGVIYTRTSHGEELRPPPTPEEREQLLERFYRPHHRRLGEAVARAVSARGGCLIVDAHSFPARPLPYEPDQRKDRPQICIGTDRHHTPALLRNAARAAFEAEGWSVAFDRPFSGAIVPASHYQVDARVWSVMVEVNRGLYLDEASANRRPEMHAVRERIQRALRRITEELRPVP